MVYKGFMYDIPAGDASQICMLLNRIIDEKPMMKVDRHLAAYHAARLELFLEVSPDVPTSSHGSADA